VLRLKNYNGKKKKHTKKEKCVFINQQHVISNTRNVSINAAMVKVGEGRLLLNRVKRQIVKQ